MDKKLYTLIVYSENIAGILNSVTAVFTRRQLNIETLNVSASSIEGVHRYTITSWSDEDTIEKVTKQIRKKIDVLQADYYTDNDIFMQEVALYKLSTPELLDNKEISKIIRHNNARLIEVNKVYAVVEKSGKTEEILHLYKELARVGTILQYVSSGRVAITRAPVERLSNYLAQIETMRGDIEKKDVNE